jgi:transcription termination factor Rho
VEDDELKRVWLMRKALSDLDSVEAMQLLIDRIKKTKTNKEFLENMSKV